MNKPKGTIMTPIDPERIMRALANIMAERDGAEVVSFRSVDRNSND